MSETAAAQPGPETAPRLSVVVTIVEGTAALRPFLDALRAQEDPPTLEILVPWDDTVAGVAPLVRDYPEVTFLEMGTVATTRPARSAAGQHELYDRRRSAALAVARGDLVAILEDRGRPRPDWARTAVRLHAEPTAVIGGAIEPAAGRLIDWALHLCDYARYSLPFESRSVDWVSDVNVTYTRQALEQTRPQWVDRFHEPLVHWELLRQGEQLRLDPTLIVDHHRAPAATGRILRERFAWGRLFGAIRASQLGTGRRLLLAAASPVIPLVVLGRHARVVRRRGETARLAAALPLLLLLLATWTAGEAWGTLTGRS